MRGDLLITKDGTLGRVAGLDRDGVCVNQSVAVARPRSGVSTDFLTSYLLSPAGQTAMLSDAGGSTIKHLYISKLGEVPVPVPPERELGCIVATVVKSREHLDSERRRLNKLHLLKNGMTNDLLTGRVRVNVGHEDAG